MLNQFPLSFSRTLRSVVQQHHGQISSAAGLLPLRQFDATLNYTRRMADCLDDPKPQREHSLLSMLRQRFYGILAGYEDCNDHDTLRDDPIFKLVAGGSSDAADENKQHRDELQRQHVHVEAKLSTLMDMRMEGEITPEEYITKRAELYDRQSALRLELERSDRDDREISDLAIQAFELSQSLQERWLTADYKAKRTILSIVLETVRLNCENVECSLRKPFIYLRDENLVPLSGGGGN